MPAESLPVVVIVDDDDDDLMFAKDAFLESGIPCDCITFKDGLNLFEHLPHLRIPALIILDISMPFMDGCELIDKIRVESTYKSIPIVFLTTSQREHIHDDCLQKADSFYVKPSTFHDWINMMKGMADRWLR